MITEGVEYLTLDLGRTGKGTIAECIYKRFRDMIHC
jgi:hypothetical protein